MGPKGATTSSGAAKKNADSSCKPSVAHTRLKSSLSKAIEAVGAPEQAATEKVEDEIDEEEANEANEAQGKSCNVEDEGAEENDVDEAVDEREADDGGEENDGDDDEEEEDDREADQPKKRRRQWELWSSEDKDIFFEAINECGKNFESIQAYFKTKIQKKGLPSAQAKNKDQVRFFYYRTWHKISKYISFAGIAKKSTQEIYGLVNYGEFRRRVGGTLDYKRGLQLQELVLQGSTSVRVKGRAIRIRTPQCRALKKFNQPQDKSRASEPLPRRISVMLSSGSMAAWTHVHSLAHNPRVKTTLSPNRPLRDLLMFLQLKWRLKNLKTCASLLMKSNQSVSVPEIQEPLLRIRPSPQCSVTLSRVTQVTADQHPCASLLSHESWLKESGAQKTTKAKTNRKSSNPTQKPFPKKPEEETISKKAEGTGEFQASVSVVDEVWEASQEETDFSDAEELGIQNRNKTNSTNLCADSQTSDEDHEAVTTTSTVPPLSRSRNQSNKNRNKTNLSVKSSGLSTSSLDPTANCDNSLPKKRNLLNHPTVGGSLATAPGCEAVSVVRKSRKGRALKIKFATNTCDDSHDEALNEDYDEHDTECDEEEVEDEEDNEEKERDNSKVKNEVSEPKEAKPPDKAAPEPAQLAVEPLCARVAAIRAGWTLASVGRLTIGELFVMLGRMNPLLLEYEFESVKKEPGSESSQSTSPVTTLARDTAVPESSDESKFKIDVKYSPSPGAVNANGNACFSSITRDTATVKPLVTAAAKPTSELSGMLSQLLDMSSQLFHKNSLLEGNKMCPCRLSKGFKSPLGGAASRSPRVPALPAARSPDVGGSNFAVPADRSRPASAKRLIAPDDVDAAATGSNKRHCVRTGESVNVMVSVTAGDFRMEVPASATRSTAVLSDQAKLEAEISIKLNIT
ncbi:uncharacterized protein LOC108668038 [Hyalella azteca]|uniref:Uncharacterized protein LOC108668038 n=1 Tax=Hyalella azteca TaxID=294128 RepID=A0A8B7NAN6_HYAAZ|nr:uncharacterized protein LOC108668038 [Hyalella azteca]